MEVFWWSILIFISRIADVSLGTIRIQMIANRRKYLAALIGFFEILIFILVVGKVLQDNADVISIIAYCAGFSCGTLVGVIIEEKLNRRIIQARIIPKTKPYDVLEEVRDSKFGATLMTGEGIEGEIDIINVVLKEDRKK